MSSPAKLLQFDEPRVMGTAYRSVRRYSGDMFKILMKICAERRTGTVTISLNQGSLTKFLFEAKENKLTDQNIQ